MSFPVDPATRWQQEASFFDEQSVEDIVPVHPLTLRRYTQRTKRRRFRLEYWYRVAGDLDGKQVLDIGCGDGRNAVMHAINGATVTGIDVSPVAIARARYRAAINGVGASASFSCGPIEAADFRPDSFDIIWGEAILHHMINDLDHVLQKVNAWARPGALAIFIEPITLSTHLRRVRSWLPIHTAATPGERPIGYREISVIKRHIPDLQIRTFGVLSWLDRYVLSSNNYERSSSLRRAASSGLAAVDYALLSLPYLWKLGSLAVLYGHLAPSVEANLDERSESPGT